ncbi:pentapeptide repeat-containing protein [Argonema antarcticum]|uniref:pentapeptide repeat-containing protein n=1 Tax=Argonema antarcticum TaxID=2942763 RepID=UPI002011199A|nr:pentapeptide repeat-containing protein [Argonema antarcticum]MCL1473149.1 pentapeptide repeat-containing protein [Argonema antarcticum A004/B2]
MEVEEFITKYEAGERNFAAANLTEANLSGLNLSGANFSGANLSVANLSGANLYSANLSHAKLNVARLSGANLTKANLNRAVLNVANLIRADLGGAELIQAALIRAELIRAELSRANLTGANLTSADLREAKLRQANLSRANLSGANLRGASLTAANLEGANLHGSDLSRADLTGANLRDAELRQANLSCTNLSGANLSGANLRWVDLSGANLRWADLSDAKLSGANLIGADLSNANLLNASLVHADLTQARLIRADWTGADLSGATLTGAKLYAVSRFGLKTEGLICEWVDLSPDGDRTQIYRLSSEEARKFFHQTLPTVQIIIDAPLDHESHFTLASCYHQIAQQQSVFYLPPSIKVGRRRTLLTFVIDNDNQLFSTAYLAILPFTDSEATHKNIIILMQMLQSPEMDNLGIKEPQRLQNLSNALIQGLSKIFASKLLKSSFVIKEDSKFFQSPTQIVLTNSSDQTLNIYHHPQFGKRFVKPSSFANPDQITSIEPVKYTPPSASVVFDFIKNFPTLEK